VKFFLTNGEIETMKIRRDTERKKK